MISCYMYIEVHVPPFLFLRKKQIIQDNFELVFLATANHWLIRNSYLRK